MEVKIIPGMLNLVNDPMAKRVTKMQQVLGKARIVKIGRHAIKHQNREVFELASMERGHFWLAMMPAGITDERGSKKFIRAKVWWFWVR
jgi:hypothetical protein